MMPTTDLIRRLESVHVDATVALEGLEDLAAHRQRGTWLAAVVVVLAVAVPVQLFVTSPTAQVRIDDPAATAVDEDSDDGWAQDPDRPWEPGELARITIDAAETPEQFGLPVALSVRASDGAKNRSSDLWITWAETEPFGSGATILRGHRTIYGAALYNLDVVTVDDLVRVSLPDGTSQTYVVTETQTLPAEQPPQVVVPDDAQDEWLLVAAPDPRWTSAQDQLIVTARRIG